MQTVHLDLRLKCFLRRNCQRFIRDVRVLSCHILFRWKKSVNNMKCLVFEAKQFFLFFVTSTFLVSTFPRANGFPFWAIHKRRRPIFPILWPPPSPLMVFLPSKIGNFWPPSPSDEMSFMDGFFDYHQMYVEIDSLKTWCGYESTIFANYGNTNYGVSSPGIKKLTRQWQFWVQRQVEWLQVLKNWQWFIFNIWFLNIFVKNILSFFNKSAVFSIGSFHIQKGLSFKNGPAILIYF